MSDPETVAGAYRTIASVIGGEFSSAALQSHVDAWLREERTASFSVGHPDFHDVAALVLAIEGARLICAVERKTAATVLRLAADALAAEEVG